MDVKWANLSIEITKQNKLSLKTRMHSSRMRTGRTVTVFRKLEDPPKFGAGTPPKIWSRHPPPPPRKFGAGNPPQKFGVGTPPENLEQAPPSKIWSRHPPPRKFGVGTPPENLEQAPPPENLEQTPPPPVNRMTDRCKNITLAKTSFRPVMRQAPVDMLQQNDINDVDFDVINEWRKTQKDEVEALKHLDVK